MDIYRNDRNYYEELMGLTGADELKELVNKWNILSENISSRSMDAPIVIPNLFIYTKPGLGNTKMLALLAGYLESKGNLVNFYGSVKFFEFKLEYCAPHTPFSEMYRLIEAINTAAGFRSEYRGIIRISVDEWVDHHDEKHFTDFLQFLERNTSHWLIVLTISDTDENDKTKKMEGIASMYLRLKKLALRMPTTTEFIESAAYQLAQYGFELEDGARVLLSESIDVLRKNKHFYGKHTITDLCRDIVYTLFSESVAVDPLITADMLADFAADSDYVKRTAHKFDGSRKLGY
ncbi:MAG: hypothetical protein IIW48_12315 [Clostridia bacterium]|nr:hypothetical protein [Clostridia bacterium]